METMTWKKKLLICLPIIFAAALAITLAACMAQAGKNLDDRIGEKSSDDGVNPDLLATTKGNYSTGLLFASNGDGTCALAGIGQCRDRDIVVPQRSEKDEKVISVASSAFVGCTQISTVSLPVGITVIGDYAFYGTSLTYISVPSAVTYIGEYAFSDCASLTAVNVDPGNEKYCSVDGVLFDKGRNTIFCYPSGKKDSEYTLRLGIRRIAPGAFNNCPTLTGITFNGTEKEWQSVKIEPNNNVFDRVKVKFANISKK